MTIFANVSTHDNIRPRLGNTAPSLGEYLGAAASDTWEDSPLSSLSRMRELNESMYGVAEVDGLDDISPIINFSPPSSPLSMEEQKQRIVDSGLEGHLQPQEGYTSEAMDIISDRKKAELGRKEIREAAPNAWGPLGVATGLGTALLDPINIASAFFPVVGEARALQLLRGASGAWGRAGVRAGIGAVEGSVGAAVVEPITYAAKTQEQADYGMTDSLLNIGFGAVFGAALQPTAGAAGEFLRARRGLRNPWEITPVTESSESLRSKLAGDMHSALVQANPNMDRPVADAAAALFDARARAWSHDMGRSVDEYYTRYRPEFATTGSAKDLLQAAIQDVHDPRIRWVSGTSAISLLPASNDTRVTEFFDAKHPVSTSHKYGVQKAKELFRGQAFANEDLGDVGVTSAGIQENRKRPTDKDMLSLALIPEIIEKARVFRVDPDANSPVGSQLHTAHALVRVEMNGEMYVAHVVFKENPVRVEGESRTQWNYYGHKIKNADISGDRAWLNELVPSTEASAFDVSLYDALKSIKNKGSRIPESVDFMYQDGRASPRTDGDTGIVPKHQEGDVPREEVESTPEETMQFFASDNPRASVTFEEDGKAVIRFFSSVDPTSAPHELYHIFRRELAETASDASAPSRVREDWRTIEEFVHSRPGEAWDVFQEERFAKAGEKFLLEGVAPNPTLQRVFERLKQWFSEIYTQAEAAGIPISDEMRKVFSNMMSVDDADGAFRKALGDLLTRDVGRDFSIKEAAQVGTDATDVNAMRSATAESAALLQENIDGVAVTDPVLAESIAKEYAPSLQEADALIAKTATYRDVLREAALCETRR